MEARAETLTWAQVKERAVKQSPAAVRAQQGVRAARADVAGVGRWPRQNPVLTGSVETGAPFGQSDDRTFSVGLQQELDVVGVAATGAGVGRQRIAVAEKEAAILRLDGLAEVADAFVDLDRAQRVLAVWLELEQTFRLIAAGTAKAAGAGEKSDLDAILAEADSAGATTELSQAKSELARAQVRLGVMVGSADPSSLQVVAIDTMPPPDARPLDEFVAAALRRRSERSLWQARQAEAEARRAFAARSALPQPTLGIGVRSERFEEGRGSLLGDPGELTGFRHQNLTLELTLSIPLPFFDRNQAEHARALADMNTAHEEVEIASREIKGAVVRAKAAVDATWLSFSRWQSLEPKLVEALALLEKGYAAGQVDLLTTLASAERVSRARILAIETRAAYLKARAELSRSLGDQP
jgi:outer membrane protein, heavy metal efflux system